MSKKNKKPQKLKARLPRGFVDRSADDIRAANAMMAKIAEVYERYGFDPVETPMFEYTDCLGKFLPDSDRPNEGVFSLTDDDDQWMSLRYDLTAPLARHVAENYNDIQLPYRTYRSGWVFRNEKPGPGRFRQFMQFDADTIGAPGVQADAEMCMMMADVMDSLGLYDLDENGNKAPQYVIRVNNRKVLDGIMEAIGLGGDENAGRRLGVLRVMDKLDRLGSIEVQKLLGGGRKDDSGDWMPGLKLTSNQISTLNKLLCFQDAFNKRTAPTTIKKIVRRIQDTPESAEIAYDVVELPFKSEFGEVNNTFSNPDNTLLVVPMLLGWNIEGLGSDARYSPPRSEDTPATEAEMGLAELFTMQKIIRSAGYNVDKIQFDLSCVRGLEYYTGPVFEAELTFPVTNEKGQEVVFGSVGGGGRYDGLVKRFTGQDVPATGFSIGVSRLMTALKNLGKLDTGKTLAPVLVTVMDGDAMGQYQSYVQQLREAGIRAEMYQGNWKKFPNQLRYADKRDCPIAIIQGSDEREQGKLQLKDMIEGKRQAAAIESNEEYRAARPGQFEIAEGDLVEEVKKLLAEQDKG